ncbi:MAG: hypothetical protein Q4F17_05140 [Eubacteriales bacterium]|nr:hypothetical protein [Eubacteriales bacterium]
MHFEDDGTSSLLYPDESGNYTLTEPPALPVAGLQFLDGFSRHSSWGNHYAGIGFALWVDESRNVFVLDLETGQRTQIEHYTWPQVPYPRMQCIPSADGQRLLIYGEPDPERENDGCISNIGVLDFGRQTYLQFARENQNDIREETIYWFDNETILIAASRDGSATQEALRDYYVYNLLAK